VVDESPDSPYQPLEEMRDAKHKTRPWSSYIWCTSYYDTHSTVLVQLARKYRDSWNKSPEERKFIQRLDACLITYATLSYFSKYIDLQNVTVSTQDPKLKD
jgi:hypothetical protein